MTCSQTAGLRAGAVVWRIALVAVVVLLSAVLLWPALLNGGPLIFHDSLQYLGQGRGGVDMVAAKIAAAVNPADVVAVAGAGDAEDQVKFLRSITYQVFAYAGTLSPLGFSGTAFLQSLIVVVLVAIIAGREAIANPLPAAVAATICVAFTALPWTVSTLMPDVFAAVAILCAIIIAARLDRIGWGGKLFVLFAGSMATLSHYGHPPVFFVAAGAALMALVLQRRVSAWAVVLAAGPLVVSFVANMGVAQVVFDEPSIVPLRLPILLARSIEDGPARWYLEENCDVYAYAICELWEEGDIPENLKGLLWSPDGILAATDEQMTRIRDEEFLILGRAFLEYPSEQTWALVGNAVRQMGLIGLADVTWGRVIEGPDGAFERLPIVPAALEDLSVIEGLQKLVVLAAIGVILLFAARDGLRVGDRERTIVFVALVGLAANAAIFGGLSIPVDRYQMRVMWIVPLIAALVWLARCHAAQDQRPAHV